MNNNRQRVVEKTSTAPTVVSLFLKGSALEQCGGGWESDQAVSWYLGVSGRSQLKINKALKKDNDIQYTKGEDVSCRMVQNH